MRKYAFIWENAIVRIAILSDEEYATLILQYQNIVDITDIQPEPQVGWTVSGNQLIPPALPLNPLEYVKEYVYRPAKAFASQLEEDFVVENIAMGITLSGRTRDVTDFLKDVLSDLRNGSLYAVLADIDALPALDPELEPFISVARIASVKNRIRSYLHLPV